MLEGTVPQGKLERAVSAILHGISLMEGDVANSEIRASVERMGELLTPSVYQNGKHYKFSYKQQRLMYYLGETGDFRRSCAMANIAEPEAAKFLSSKKFMDFFGERVDEAAVRKGWTPDRFIGELNRVWTGEKEVTREQMDAIKEIGARVAPKIERIQHEFDAAEFEFNPKDE